MAGAWTTGPHTVPGLGWTREPRGTEFSTLNCRAIKMMDPSQGGVETFAIWWGLSAEEAQSREGGHIPSPAKADQPPLCTQRRMSGREQEFN